ncbi:hypothetical protein KBC75_00015 [Candidatus Shapirobacteria bacterium]|nr:hypothetical protein [Candidatus Shapirobacteria bacterium]
MTLNWWQAFLIALVSLDLFFLNFKIFFRQTPYQNPPVSEEKIVPTASDTCGTNCQKYIDSKINQAIIALPTSKSTIQTTVITSVPVSRSKIRAVSYLPIPSTGSTGNNNWSDLPGTDFYFDKADYPGLVSIYFETNIKLFNGNGTAFIRLYDVTHGVGIQGSDVQTNNQPDTAVVSGQVSFYQGKNLIRVQAKSLTADTAIFSSGRLKIITEN